MEANSPSNPTLAIRDGYDRWAAVYDHDANPMPALETPFVQQLIGTVTGLDALDLGCGTGRHAIWLAESGARVTALDFSEEMLAQARAKAPDAPIDYGIHDLHDPLPLEDGSFDLVVSGLVLEHLTELSPFFCEVRRVLRPAGRAVISNMHPAMFLRGSQARFTDPDSGEIVQPGSYPHQTSQFVTAALAAGLTLTHLGEHVPDEAFTSRFPRAEKYLGYPMLLVMAFTA